jgi:transcriptional regulator with PAS, ATPase and Fis domain
MENQIHFDPLLLLDSIYNGIVAIDASGIVVYFNKTAERILKTTATEAMGRYVLDVLPNTGGKIIESLQTGRTFQTEKLKGGGSSSSPTSALLSRMGQSPASSASFKTHPRLRLFQKNSIFSGI